jgi:hypothetical protein
MELYKRMKRNVLVALHGMSPSIDKIVTPSPPKKELKL